MNLFDCNGTSNHTPEQLKAVDQWLPGRGYDKRPLNLKTGEVADGTAKENHYTFEEVCAYSGATGALTGFALTPNDDFICFDFDNVRNPVTGEIDFRVRKMIEYLDSFAEVSVSGKGMHVILFGRIPALKQGKTDMVIKVNVGYEFDKPSKIEVFQYGQYVAVTGQHLNGTPRDVEERYDKAESFFDLMPFPIKKDPVPAALENVVQTVQRQTDAEVIAHLVRRCYGVWSGIDSLVEEPEMRGDRSRQIMSLGNYVAYECGPGQEEQAERIIALSPQWLIHHGKRHRRENYISNHVLKKAYDGRTEFRHGALGYIETICLADVEAKPLEWLWHEKIEKAGFCMLTGVGGVGKTNVSLDIIAKASTGEPWPETDDRREPMNVLLLSAEDRMGVVVQPTLDLMGADLTKIRFLSKVIEPTGDEWFNFVSHMDYLRNCIRKWKIGLCVISPLNSYMPSRIDTNTDNAVRDALGPLMSLGDETGCTTIGIHHSRKGASTAADAVMGSAAFRNLPRTVLTVAERKTGLSVEKLLMVTKANLVHKVRHLGFELVPQPNNPTYPQVIWGDSVDVDPDDVLMRTKDAEDLDKVAADWLLELLAPGPMETPAIFEMAGKDKISPKRLKDITSKGNNVLGIVKKPSTANGNWTWALPK